MQHVRNMYAMCMQYVCNCVNFIHPKKSYSFSSFTGASDIHGMYTTQTECYLRHV
jgi:hypothetical protein